RRPLRHRKSAPRPRSPSDDGDGVRPQTREAMSEQANHVGVQKLGTGIGSFDVIAKGGLPENRTTLLSGTAGSGKTVFAMQFLAAGIRDADQRGVFVTFEESAADIRKNM